MFVQAGALLWARSRAFLGVNFNESGTAFAYQRRFTRIQGVSGPPYFLLPFDHFKINIFIHGNDQLSAVTE